MVKEDRLRPPAETAIRRWSRALRIKTGIALLAGAASGIAVGALGIWPASAALAIVGLGVFGYVGKLTDTRLHRLGLERYLWEGEVSAYVSETAELPMPLIRSIFGREPLIGDPDFPDAYATWSFIHEEAGTRIKHTVTVTETGQVGILSRSLIEA